MFRLQAALLRAGKLIIYYFSYLFRHYCVGMPLHNNCFARP